LWLNQLRNLGSPSSNRSLIQALTIIGDEAGSYFDHDAFCIG
jgi:hypothetical protein